MGGNERVFSQLTDEREGGGLSRYEQLPDNLRVKIYFPPPYSWYREHKATNGVNERGRQREPEGDVSLGEQRQREGRRRRPCVRRGEVEVATYAPLLLLLATTSLNLCPPGAARSPPVTQFTSSQQLASLNCHSLHDFSAFTIFPADATFFSCLEFWDYVLSH